MPRLGPRRPVVGIRIAESDIALVDERASTEADGNRSEMARRMLLFAVANMPTGWVPPEDDE